MNNGSESVSSPMPDPTNLIAINWLRVKRVGKEASCLSKKTVSTVVQ